MVLPINLILYLLIKRNSSTFIQITFFVFIFSFPTLVNHKEKPGSSVYQKSMGPGRALEGYMKHQISIHVFERFYFYLREL